MEYLLPTPNGAREPKTTETPVGTVLTVRPLAVRGRDVTVHVKFAHSRAQWPQTMDAGSSLPIGPPIMSTQTLTSATLQLTSGEPMIASGFDASGAHTFTVIRAEVLPN
jgi:hypothetical protein